MLPSSQARTSRRHSHWMEHRYVCVGLSLVISAQIAAGKRSTCSINSCLCPVGSLDGAAVTTVEAIGNSADGFHPVQGEQEPAPAGRSGLTSLLGAHCCSYAQDITANFAFQCQHAKASSLQRPACKDSLPAQPPWLCRTMALYLLSAAVRGHLNISPPQSEHQI